jgi:hypothetical protein
VTLRAEIGSLLLICAIGCSLTAVLIGRELTTERLGRGASWSSDADPAAGSWTERGLRLRRRVLTLLLVGIALTAAGVLALKAAT